MANALPILSLLSGGITGFNQGQKDAQAQTDKDAQDAKDAAQQAKDDAAQKAQDQRDATDKATDAFRGYYQQNWRGDPAAHYGQALAYAKAYGVDDPDSFARTQLGAVGVAVPAQQAPQVQGPPALAPLTGGSGTSTAGRTLAPLTRSPMMNGAAAAPGPAPTLQPLTSTPSPATTSTSTTQPPPAALPPLSGAPTLQPLQAGSAPSADPNSDPYLVDLMRDASDPRNPNRDQTLKDLAAYRKQQSEDAASAATVATKKVEAGKYAADITKDNADIAATREKEIGGIGDQSQDTSTQDQAIQRINAAYPNLPPLPLIGQPTGLQRTMPVTSAVGPFGPGSPQPTKSFPVLQRPYLPDLKTGADIVDANARARVSNDNAATIEAKFPFVKPQAQADLNKTVAEGNKASDYGLGPQQASADLQKTLNEAAESTDRADHDKADVAFLQSTDDLRLSSAKQERLKVVSGIAKQLGSIGLQTDANGNYIVPPDGVTIPGKPILDSRGQPVIDPKTSKPQVGPPTVIPASAINTAINQLHSAQQDANHIDGLLNDKRATNPLKDVIGNDYGTSGCVRGARAVAGALGLPFPAGGDGVGYVQARMLKAGYVKTSNPSTANFFIMPGSGGPHNPSGLHMGAIVGQVSLQADTRGDTELHPYPIPHGKGVTYYRYVGTGGGSAATGAPGPAPMNPNSPPTNGVVHDFGGGWVLKRKS